MLAGGRVDDEVEIAAAGPGPPGRPARGACPAAGAGTSRSASTRRPAPDSSPRRVVITSPVTPTWSPRSTRGPRTRRATSAVSITCRSPDPVPQRREAQLAVVAQQHDPAGDRDPVAGAPCPAARCAMLRADRAAPSGAGEAQRVRVDAGRPEPVELRQPYPHLLRRPPAAATGASAVSSRPARTSTTTADVSAVRRPAALPRRSSVRRLGTHDEALGDRRREADPGQVADVARSTGSAAPTRAGTWRWTGRATRAATSARRTAAAGATAAGPGRRRSGRPPRRRRGTRRS